MDAGRKEVDKKLEHLEKSIAKEYGKAIKEIQKKFEDSAKQLNIKADEMKKKVESGDIDQEEFNNWYSKEIVASSRWQKMIDDLSNDMVYADKTAMRMLNSYLPDMLADAMNYEAYEIEKKVGVNTAFTLYNREAVAHMLINNPSLLPVATIDIAEDKRWNKSKIISAVTQGILQGDSVPNIAKRLQTVTDMGASAAVRNARTMTTYAEASGRMQSMYRAKNMGIAIMKEWQSTLDGRTRHSHRVLDGERQELDEPFSNGLMEPSDPDGPAEEVYNCRCGIVSYFPKYDIGYSSEEKDELSRQKNGLSYNEWKSEHIEKSIINIDDSIVLVGKSAKELLDDVYIETEDDLSGVNLQVLKPVLTRFKALERPFGALGKSNLKLMVRRLPEGDVIRIVPEKTAYNAGLMLLNAEFFKSDRKGATKYIFDIKERVTNKTFMPCSDEQLKYYVPTHEYGHVVLNLVLEKQLLDTGWYIKNPNAHDENWYKRNKIIKAEEIKSEIIQIALGLEPNADIDSLISKYGNEENKPNEFFAECFANAYCGAPNLLGRAIDIWLKTRY